MKPQKEHGGSHRNIRGKGTALRARSRKKARAALALAVSLWMANGVFWAPGVASAEQEVTITSKADATAQATGANPALLYIPSAGGHDFNFYCLNNDTKMKIAGGECKGANFSAGYSENGEASGYTLTVEKGTFDATTELAGGYSLNGTANNNSVYIKDGEGGAYVYGGRGEVGASGNTVDMTGGTVGLVHGAYTHDGDAEKNTVTIKGGTVDRVFGGESHAGSATGNSVTVSGGTIGTGDEGDGVYGGRVYGTSNGAGDAEKNTVTVSGGKIDGSVYGGGVGSETKSKAAATGNSVTISETDTAAPTTIKKEVYGGYSQYNAANKNILEISGGTVNSSVYGGMGGTEATGNTVTISGGAIGTDITNNIYGGRGNTDASENKVTISGGTMSGQVYGGYTGATGTANKNFLEISGGTVDSSVTGGYVDSFDDAATAEGNTVKIEGGTVNGDVNGGVAGSATDNTVTISGGTIKNSVYGGSGSTKATGNTVTISGGTIDSNGIYGGYSDSGAANDNTVEISGGEYGEMAIDNLDIYGGYSSKGEATGNTVKISVANFEAGRICVGDGATSTGNKLVLDAKGIDVYSDVGGVQTIALTKNVKFEDNTTVLKAGKFAIDNNAATNFDGTLDLSAASFAGDGAMTLLEVTSGNEKDNLATMTVAYTDGKGQAQTGTLTVDTPVRIKAGKENITYAQNNVTLTYDSNVQQVAMKDAGQKVVLESGINGSVKDVAMGTVQWQKGSTAMDAAGAGFTLDGKTTLTDNLAIDFADAEKEAAVNDTMTLLAANQEMATLSDDFKNFSRTIEKEYSVDTAGVSIDAKVTATATASGKSLTAAITANRATKLTFTNVDWLDSGALIDHKTTLTNISFEGADVDTAKISFTNLQTLDTDSKMTLVSGFGTSAGAVTGTAFTVGEGTGGGHAYLESNDLKYVVTQGVDFKPTGDDNAINAAGDPVGGEIASDVIGGVARNDGVAKENTMIVLPASSVAGSVTAAISENGASEKNEAKVTDSTVSGSVTGAVVNGTGTAADNKATVGNTNVGDGQTHTGDVIGAKTDSGLATGNIADVTGGSVEGNVMGAQSTSGTVSTGNEAKVSGANVGGDVYGGVSTDGEANANKAELSGGAVVNGDVYGGVSENKTAAANIVTIENAKVEGDVYGGKSKEVSRNNVVDFNGGTVKNLIGGGCETATENYVSVEDGFVAQFAVGGLASKTATGNTVTMTGGSVDNGIYGGYGETGAANKNHVYLGGGTVSGISPYDPVTVDGFTLKDGGVYGGYSVSGATQDNSVTLYAAADVSAANLWGGNREATGNALHIGWVAEDGTPIPWKGGENGPKVKSISNFETVSFDVVQWNTDTPALVVGEGTSELSGTVSAKNVIFTGVDKLDAKDVMTLVKNLPATAKVDEASAFTIGSLIEGTGTLSLDGDGNVIYTVKDVTSGEKAHSAVMGLEAGMAALSVGNDFIGDATAGLGLPANEGADGVSTFAKLGGGKLRQTTGSHVDVNTWNAIIAIGKKNQGEKSSFEYGAFFEYGSGNYTTHNGAERGDGSARYTGGGLLAKWKQAGGLYVEGSLRAGTVKDDAKNVLRDGAGVPYSYDTSAGYFGAHIGVGREIGLKGGNTLDVYGKYFYNRRNGVSFDAGGHYDLDAITSSVLRVGARYTMKREAWNFYGGLAYEYEMDGEAKGKAGGLAIRGADIGGGSARLELGATMTPAKSPWTLDLNLTGFAGKKRGLMGGVSVGFMF